MAEFRKLEELYTYSDYFGWGETTRYELIDGVIYAMSPAPTRRHQEVLIELGFKFKTFLIGKKCKFFMAPFDVRLGDEEDVDTTVQPDLVIVCDRSKLDRLGCKGAPDLVVEILSQGSKTRDTKIKFKKYQDAGIKEYWIVDPDEERIAQNILVGGRYKTTEFCKEDRISSVVLDGFDVNISEIFEED